MYQVQQTIWRLVQSTAEQLASEGSTPFTRGDLINGVQSKNPKYGPDSINPIIQGVTDNLRGGAPGAADKRILHSVGRGQFELHPRLKAVSKTKITAKNDEQQQPKEKSNAPQPSPSRETGFKFICKIEPQLDPDGNVEELQPQDEYDNWRKLKIHRYGHGPFCKFKIPSGLNKSGVYLILVDGESLYVGECENLSSRFNSGYGNVSPRNCYVGGQETNCRINNLILNASKTNSTIKMLFMETERHKQIELALRRTRKYEWNRI